MEEDEIFKQLRANIDEDKLAEIQKFINEESEKIAGQVLQSSIAQFGNKDVISLGTAVDTLAQATGRIASILAMLTGRGDDIIIGISKSMKEYINNFEKFMKEQKPDVAVAKEED